MTEQHPWVESPPILRERQIIQRSLLFWTSCHSCKLLGWDKNCPEKKDPGCGRCGMYLYGKLKEHFKEWEKIEQPSSADTVRH